MLTRFEKLKLELTAEKSIYTVMKRGGGNIRLRLLNEVRKFYLENNIKFETELFDFKEQNKYNHSVKSKSINSQSSVSLTYANETERLVIVNISRSFKQAANSSQKQNWFEAVKDELKIITDRKV